MALVDCYECGRQVSTAATACPQCGAPQSEPPPLASLATVQQVLPETSVWEGTASHWKYAAHWFLGILLLPFYGAGLLFLLWIWLDRSSRRYRVTSKRVITEVGIFSKGSSEIRIRDIRVINLLRSGVGGMFGVGTLQFGSAGTAGIEVAFEAVTDAERLKETINTFRHDAS